MTIPDTQFVLEMRLEIDHLLDCYSLSNAAAMKPKLVNGLLVDSLRVADLIVVQLQAHELVRSHQLELSAKVRDSSWGELKDSIEVRCSITSTLIELLIA